MEDVVRENLKRLFRELEELRRLEEEKLEEIRREARMMEGGDEIDAERRAERRWSDGES